MPPATPEATLMSQRMKCPVCAFAWNAVGDVADQRVWCPECGETCRTPEASDDDIPAVRAAAWPTSQKRKTRKPAASKRTPASPPRKRSFLENYIRHELHTYKIFAAILGVLFIIGVIVTGALGFLNLLFPGLVPQGAPRQPTPQTIYFPSPPPMPEMPKQYQMLKEVQKAVDADRDFPPTPVTVDVFRRQDEIWKEHDKAMRDMRERMGMPPRRDPFAGIPDPWAGRRDPWGRGP